jgi:hypothetical protein
MARTYGFLAASAAVLLAAGLAACNSQGTTAQTGRLERQGSVPTTTAAAVPADYRRVEDKTLVVQPFNMTVDKIHRMDVVTSNGEQIGDINHVLVDRSGRVTAMTITSGGVLGLGAREHIVPLGDLKLQGDRFMTSLRKDQIERLPVYGNPQR